MNADVSLVMKLKLPVKTDHRYCFEIDGYRLVTFFVCREIIKGKKGERSAGDGWYFTDEHGYYIDGAGSMDNAVMYDNEADATLVMCQEVLKDTDCDDLAAEEMRQFIMRRKSFQYTKGRAFNVFNESLSTIA